MKSWFKAAVPRVAAWRRRMTRTVSGEFPVMLYVSGVLIFAFHLHLAWHPAGGLFLGAAMVNWALKLDRGAKE